MAANRPLKTNTDQPSVDSFAHAGERICSGTVIASGDYHVAAPAPAEFSPPEGSTSCTLTIDATITAASIVFNLEGYDPASNKWILLIASAAVVATGTTEINISAYATAVANVTAQRQLRATMRVRPVGTGTAATYSVGAHFSN
jgi:hypothetical protein